MDALVENRSWDEYQAPALPLLLQMLDISSGAVTSGAVTNTSGSLSVLPDMMVVAESPLGRNGKCKEKQVSGRPSIHKPALGLRPVLP